MGALDVMIAYKFVKILATPWTKTDAYKLGIIDEKGNVLIKKKDLKTGKQKKAYTIIHRLTWNIKKLLDKLPPTRTKLGSFAAALWLLKEEWDLEEDNTLLEMSFLDHTGSDFVIQEDKKHLQKMERGNYLLRQGVKTMYEDIKPNDTIIIRKTQPKGKVFGIQLFEGIHKSTGKKVLISNEDLLKIY